MRAAADRKIAKASSIGVASANHRRVRLPRAQSFHCGDVGGLRHQSRTWKICLREPVGSTHVKMQHAASDGILWGGDIAGFERSKPKAVGEPRMRNVEKFMPFRQIG